MADDECFYFERNPPAKDDSRAHVVVHREGLLLRVDDDHYDCELPPEEAVALARAILAKYGS